MSDQTKDFVNELVKISKQNLIAIGYQQLTVDNTAGGVALTVPAESKYALIVLESSISTIAIRYLECGKSVSTVSAGVGIPRSHLDAFDVQGAENLKNFRAIQEGAGTHKLNIAYYK